MAAEDTKRRLVEVTYQLIKDEGLEGVSARIVAKKAGCTATVIYKYFDNLNYLIVVSSLRFLEEYIQFGADLSAGGGDLIEMDKKAWKAFIHYAFTYPRIYENLFWGKGNEVYGDAVTEYFQLFPEELYKHTSAYFYTSIYSPSMEEREFVWLRKVANEGRLSLDDAAYIARVNDFIIHGMLMEYLAKGESPELTERMKKECFSMIEKNIDRFVKKEDK